MDQNIHTISSSRTYFSEVTHAVILAAGLGSRLKENTRDIPKCMVNVANVRMIDRMLRVLKGMGISSVTIAVGYLDHVVVDFLNGAYPEGCGMDIQLVRNPDYAITGSVFSLSLALEQLPEHGNALLIEGDVVLQPELLHKLVNELRSKSDASTLLAPYEPILSGTFALIEDGLVSAWLHESVRAKDFDATVAFKTVNLTFVKAGGARLRLRDAVKKVISGKGVRAPLEYAMQDLVLSGLKIDAVLTDSMKWFEVDTPEDLEIANAMFAQD